MDGKDKQDGLHSDKQVRQYVAVKSVQKQTRGNLYNLFKV